MQSLHKLKAHRDGHTFSPVPVNVQTPMPLSLSTHLNDNFYIGSILKGGLTYPALYKGQFKLYNSWLLVSGHM